MFTKAFSWLRKRSWILFGLVVLTVIVVLLHSGNDVTTSRSSTTQSSPSAQTFASSETSSIPVTTTPAAAVLPTDFFAAPTTGSTTYPYVTTVASTCTVSTTPLLAPGVAGVTPVPLPVNTPQLTQLKTQYKALLTDFFTFSGDDQMVAVTQTVNGLQVTRTIDKTIHDRVAHDVSAVELAKFDFGFTLNQQYATLVKQEHLSTLAVPETDPQKLANPDPLRDALKETLVAYPDDKTLHGFDIRVVVQLAVVNTRGQSCSSYGPPYWRYYSTHWSFVDSHWVMDDSSPFHSPS